MSDLTPKQERFCREYIKDGNGTQAAIRAGYATSGADVQAIRLLGNARIQAYMDELKREQAERLEISADRIVQEIASIAFESITDVIEFDANGVTLKSSKKLPKRTKSAINSVSVTVNPKTGDVKTQVKMHDKLAALEKLMKKFNLYPKEMAVLEALGLLLNEGMATTDQARVVADGIKDIEARIRGLSGGESESDTD